MVDQTQSSLIKAEGTGRDSYGSLSGHGGYVDCEGVDIGLLLTAVLGIGAAFFALFTKITMIGRRKKRDLLDQSSSSSSDLVNTLINELHGVLYGGNALSLSLGVFFYTVDLCSVRICGFISLRRGVKSECSRLCCTVDPSQSWNCQTSSSSDLSVPVCLSCSFSPHLGS